MDFKKYCKKLTLPSGVTAPIELHFQDLVARPLARKDLKDDMEAVNSSLDLIRRTRGGSWPQEAVTEEFDLLDLAWHEREFRDGNSYAYVVYDQNGVYVGCFYLYGLGVQTELMEALTSFEVDASWWVSSDAYEQGYYKKLQAALNSWLYDEFKFKSIYYSNAEL